MGDIRYYHYHLSRQISFHFKAYCTTTGLNSCSHISDYKMALHICSLVFAAPLLVVAVDDMPSSPWIQLPNAGWSARSGLRMEAQGVGHWGGLLSASARRSLVTPCSTQH